MVLVAIQPARLRLYFPWSCWDMHIRELFTLFG